MSMDRLPGGLPSQVGRAIAEAIVTCPSPWLACGRLRFGQPETHGSGHLSPTRRAADRQARGNNSTPSGSCRDQCRRTQTSRRAGRGQHHCLGPVDFCPVTSCSNLAHTNLHTTPTRFPPCPKPHTSWLSEENCLREGPMERTSVILPTTLLTWGSPHVS